jgi:hypothetical protein
VARSGKSKGRGVQHIEGSMPAEDLLAAIVLDRNLSLSPERLGLARDFLTRFRKELDQVRSVELAFLPPYIEPETAVRWIENGGRSQSRA